jgi:hypothetical protein
MMSHSDGWISGAAAEYQVTVVETDFMASELLGIQIDF